MSIEDKLAAMCEASAKRIPLERLAIVHAAPISSAGLAYWIK